MEERLKYIYSEPLVFRLNKWVVIFRGRKIVQNCKNGNAIEVLFVGLSKFQYGHN
jgi:hypothetical protein